MYIDSLQPDSLARIQELESYSAPVAPATPAIMEAPKFITQLSDVTQLKEGQSAHFEARLTPVKDSNLTVSLIFRYSTFLVRIVRKVSRDHVSYGQKLRSTKFSQVEWFYNGKKLPHGHRFRTFHDFGLVILDILYCYEENSGVYECRATNKLGTDSTKATLKCYSKSNLILESQLPKVKIILFASTKIFQSVTVGRGAY